MIHSHHTWFCSTDQSVRRTHTHKHTQTQVVVNYASSADSANEVVKEIKVRLYKCKTYMI